MKTLFPLARRSGWAARAAAAWLFAPLLFAAAADTANETSVERPHFTFKYPAHWKEDTGAPDYDANNNFSINSDKNTYVAFNITDKAEDPQKVLDAAVFNLNNTGITVLSKSKFEEWGPHKGRGLHMKGKIMDTYPGGIKAFVFNSGSHNVLVIEFYFSEDLKDVMSGLEFISQNFQMKN